MSQTVTLTFGDVAENHRGMQKIGSLADEGFTVGDLEEIQSYFGGDITYLNAALPSGKEATEAAIYILRNGVNILCEQENFADLLFEEQLSLTPDKQAYMYGRVVNKHARWNLCFNHVGQEPDYESGKGSIVAFSNVPLLQSLRKNMKKLGKKAEELMVEGNYYYDITKTGIGFHGDTERKKVIGVRLGATFPLHYQWFVKSNPIGERVKLSLNHGDFYIMSEKASGFDWKSKNFPTLRHAAGAAKFLLI